MSRVRWCLGLVLLGCVGCGGGGGGGGEQDAGPPPDICNSKDEAAGADCTLTLGEAVTSYISFSGDEDWFSLNTPSTLTARSLVHVTAGYSAQATAVNLAVNVLAPDGTQSLSRKVDKHGAGAPRPVDIIFPYSTGGSRLFVQLSDEPATGATKNFDARSPYSLMAEVVENPDVNEPNDTTPTPIALSGGTGMQSGYLATTDDKDVFSIAVPGGRNVLWLNVTGPQLSPPPPFRLGYTLKDGAGNSISEGHVDSEFLAVNLATARLTTAAATYTLTVEAYRGLSTTGSIPGDLRFEYDVEVRIIPEVDAQEPNDTPATAKVVSLGAPGAAMQTLTGRLGYVPDFDYYRVDFGSSPSVPTALYYRLRPAAGGGRFPATSATNDRQIRMYKTIAAGSTSCVNTASVCPRDTAGRGDLQSLMETYCTAFTPPRCLLSARDENSRFTSLRNFEGRVLVPPNNTLPYYFLVEDQANDFADDKDYTLELQWVSLDSDEVNAWSGGTKNAVARTMANTTAPTPNWNVSPTGVTYEYNGRLSYGLGRLIDNDYNRGDGAFGPEDYDAVQDKDTFTVGFGGVTGDKQWILEWDLSHGTDGKPAYGLALELEFCDGSVSTSTCTKVPSNGALVLAYKGAEQSSWWNRMPPYVAQALYERTVGASATTIRARKYACYCLESRFLTYGSFTVRVAASDRASFQDTTYRLRMATIPYPQLYDLKAGGTDTCPVAGCGLTK